MESYKAIVTFKSPQEREELLDFWEREGAYNIPTVRCEIRYEQGALYLDRNDFVTYSSAEFWNTHQSRYSYSFTGALQEYYAEIGVSDRIDIDVSEFL